MMERHPDVFVTPRVLELREAETLTRSVMQLAFNAIGGRPDDKFVLTVEYDHLSCSICSHKLDKQSNDAHGQLGSAVNDVVFCMYAAWRHAQDTWHPREFADELEEYFGPELDDGYYAY